MSEVHDSYNKLLVALKNKNTDDICYSLLGIIRVVCDEVDNFENKHYLEEELKPYKATTIFADKATSFKFYVDCDSSYTGSIVSSKIAVIGKLKGCDVTDFDARYFDNNGDPVIKVSVTVKSPTDIDITRDDAVFKVSFCFEDD